MEISQQSGQPDTGDTAWMLTSAALVLLMTPGLAFFYGGMVRAKSVLNMIMMSIGAMGVVGILWVLYGYSVAFGEDKGGLFGDPFQYFGLKGLIGGDATWPSTDDPAPGDATPRSRWSAPSRQRCSSPSRRCSRSSPSP